MANDYDLKKSYTLNVVGKVSMNYFAGRMSPLVMIEDYEIKEIPTGLEVFNETKTAHIWGEI